MRRAVPSLAVLLAAARLAAQPASGEVRVNSYQTGGQFDPRVAAGGDGFVIVWRGFDAHSNGVLWRTTNVLGAKTADPDFRANTIQTGTQIDPDVASLPSYGWIVVWNDVTNGIFGQRYESNGTPAGSNFPVSFSTAVGHPSVASRPDGSFVVAYEYTGGATYRIFGRRFDANGAPLSTEFSVTSPVTASQSKPSVAAWAGGFVVVWTGDTYATDDERGVFGRRFYDDGSPVTGVFHVNTYTTGFQQNVAVAGKGDASFVVTWQSTDGDGSGIRARHYAPAGVPSSEFGVNTYTTSDQTFPRIAADMNGDYLVAWSSNGQDGDMSGVFAQRFDESGQRLGGEFQANTSTIGSQAVPAVAPSVTNHYHMIAWEGPDADSYGVYVRSYCLKGDANGDATIDIADVFHMINDLFASGPPSVCPDVNASGVFDVADVFYLINYLFASGPAPV